MAGSPVKRARKASLLERVAAIQDSVAIPENALEMRVSIDDCLRVGMRGDPPAPHQRAFAYAPESKREIFYFGANGNGKSAVAIDKIMCECMKYPGQNAVFACLELAKFKGTEWNSLWKPRIDRYKKDLIPGLRVFDSDTNFCIVYPNGTVLQFVTFIDEAKLQGDSIDLFCGREITQMPESHLKRVQMQSRSSDRMRTAMEACGVDWATGHVLPRRWYIGNPPDAIRNEDRALGRNSSRSHRHFTYLKTQFYDLAERGELPDHKLLIKASFEGCNWPGMKEFIAQLKEAIPNEEAFRRYASGEWEIYSDKDSFYGRIESDFSLPPWERHVIDWNEFEDIKSTGSAPDPLFFGYDDGTYEAMGLVGVVVKKGVAYVVGARSRRELSPAEVVEEARSIAETGDFLFDGHTARCDPATEKKTYQGQGVANRYAEIRDYGLDIRPAITNEWFVTAEVIRRLLRVKALKFVVGRENGVDKLVAQMSSMQRRPLGMDQPNQPMKGTPRHLGDALRYILVERALTELLVVDPKVEELEKKLADRQMNPDVPYWDHRDEREALKWDRRPAEHWHREMDATRGTQGHSEMDRRNGSPVDMGRRLFGLLGSRRR